MPSTEGREHWQLFAAERVREFLAQPASAEAELRPALESMLLSAMEFAQQHGAELPKKGEYVGDGMFAGETLATAALGWALWCDARHFEGLRKFLLKVSTPLAQVPEEVPA